PVPAPSGRVPLSLHDALPIWNRLLNQLTADACGRRVVAGPEEATALGNVLVQARALGDLPRGVAIRDVARASATLSEFLPVTVRSEEHTSELQSRVDLVCRLL